MNASPASRLAAPRGFTLIEGVIASFILAISVIGTIQGLNYGFVIVKRAQHETECEMKCITRVERVMTTPYVNLTNAFPLEFVGIAKKGQVTTDWWCRTVVAETNYAPVAGTDPVVFKRVDITAQWNTYGGKQRSVNYMILRAPVEMRNPF